MAKSISEDLSLNSDNYCEVTAELAQAPRAEFCNKSEGIDPTLHSRHVSLERKTNFAHKFEAITQHCLSSLGACRAEALTPDLE